MDVSNAPSTRADAGAPREPQLPEALVGPVYSSVSPLRAAEIMAFGPVSTTQLSQALCCHERTARRVLERLVDEGWTCCTGGVQRRYSLSLRAAAMGAQALSRSPFASLAAGLARELGVRANRAVFVAVPC